MSMDNTSPDSRGPRVRQTIEKAYAELDAGVWSDHESEDTVAKKAVCWASLDMGN